MIDSFNIDSDKNAYNLKYVNNCLSYFNSFNHNSPEKNEKFGKLCQFQKKIIPQI